MSHWIYKQKSQ